MVGRYDYKELRAKAESGSQEDINNLGRWFEDYGGRYWNGEFWDADGLKVYPIYKDAANGNFGVKGYRAE